MTGPTGGGITTVGRGAGLGGAVVQADIARATAPTETSKLRVDNRDEDIRIAMWVLMIEAGVALFLLVFIVWWTMYSGKKPSDHEHEQLSAPPKDETDKLER